MNASAKKHSDRQFREAVVKLKVAGLSLGEIDPYKYKSKKLTKTKNALTLKISGSNYVSEKTRTTFEEALQDGYKIQQAVAETPQPNRNNPSESTMSKTEKETIKENGY